MKYRVIYTDTRMFSVDIEANDEGEAEEKADEYIAKNSDEWYYDDENYEINEIKENKISEEILDEHIKDSRGK